jgi:hypothetical protein
MVAVIWPNPLKVILDAITANREINRKRKRQAMQHEEVMSRESRKSEQSKRADELAAARLQIEAATVRHDVTMDLLGQLTADRRSAAAEKLLQQLTGIADDIPVNGVPMPRNVAELEAADIPGQDSGESGPVDG